MFPGFEDSICISCMFLYFIQLKEKDEDYLAAINLYMKAGLPARAARLAISREVIRENILI